MPLHSDLRTGPRNHRLIPSGASAPADRRDSRSVGGTTLMTVTSVYPVRVDAHLDPHLSRWLWLVKWILAIPHYIVLIPLWIAFCVVSVTDWPMAIAIVSGEATSIRPNSEDAPT